MSIKIIAVGQKMPDWVNTAFSEYQKRLPNDWWHTTLIEVPLAQRNKTASLAQQLAKETEALLAAVGRAETIIALDEKGDSFTTNVFLHQLQKLSDQSQHVNFLIGGPDGLSSHCKQQATHRWSLSPLTLPHPLARIVLIEQLYRAYTLAKHHPYHR